MSETLPESLPCCIYHQSDRLLEPAGVAQPAVAAQGRGRECVRASVQRLPSLEAVRHVGKPTEQPALNF